jgi:pimeloyl-ACP methyl ester carboxylesterase
LTTVGEFEETMKRITLALALLLSLVPTASFADHTQQPVTHRNLLLKRLGPARPTDDCFGFIDPNPKLLSGGKISPSDAKTMSEKISKAEQGEFTDVCGVAADGVTLIVMPFLYEGRETPTVCIEGASGTENGGLANIGSTAYGRCVTVTIVETPEIGTAIYGGIAIFQAPAEFVQKKEDEGKEEREIEFKVEVQPAFSDKYEYTRTLKLVRPPVVLIHGLWSSAATWQFPLMQDSRFQVFAGDYQNTNAARFRQNLGRPREFIDRALQAARRDKIAVTQVDVVGHSMGGILTRNHINLQNYKRNENFMQGDVHKLITLNTPHLGSPLANRLIALGNLNFGRGALVRRTARAFGAPIDQGAIDDLSVGSGAIRAIQSTAAPSHAVIGIGGEAFLNDETTWVGELYSWLAWYDPTIRQVFGGEQHDAIVARGSQADGIGTSAQTVFDGLNSVHTNVTGSGDHSSRIIELANLSTKNSAFSNFSGNLLQVQNHANPSNALRTPASPSAAGVVSPGLSIVSPVSGTSVSSGSSVAFTLAPPPGVSITRLLLVGPSVAVSQTGSMQIAFPIPKDAIGNYEIEAVGADAAGNFYTATALLLKVTPTASLTSISVMPSDGIALSLNDRRQLSVLGRYSDGVVRDITASAGTVYASSVLTVAQISSGGLVTPQGAGNTILSITNGASVITTTFTVISQANQAPVAYAGENQFVAINSVVRLAGDGSYDPDFGPAPLSYAWRQTAGPTVPLSSLVSVMPEFMPTATGNYVFELTVRDGLTDSTTSSVSVFVLGDLNRKVFLPFIRRP